MLDPKDKRVLSDLKTIINSLNLPMLVVGAGARLLIFDRQFRITGRSTQDWDVAVSVTSWEDFQALSDRMTQGRAALFTATRIPHRFIHTATGTEVDIVPFGDVAGQNRQIEWADGNQMNVAGLEEALLHAVVETIDDLELQVIDTPAFIVLKLFAWGDRKAKTNKDLDDIAFIFSHYTDDDRVFEELTEELSSGEIEYLDAAIYLLAQDIRRIFRDETILELDEILNQLAEQMSEISESLKRQLEILRKGINSE